MRTQKLLIISAVCVLGLYLSWQLGLHKLFDPLLMPAEYLEGCKAAGVRILKRPQVPVSSVVLDSVPLPVRAIRTRYEFSIGGWLKNVQFHAPNLDKHLTRFEIRQELQYGADPSKLRFTRFQRGKEPTTVEESSADVIVLDTVGNAEEFQKPLRHQQMTTHSLKVTDQRNGDVLAEMIFILDIERRRGCGLNTNNAIDVDAFIMEATRP